jgi:hypothetical protein
VTAVGCDFNRSLIKNSPGLPGFASQALPGFFLFVLVARQYIEEQLSSNLSADEKIFTCYIYFMKNLFLALFILFLYACASSVNVDFDPKTSFAGINTFQVQAKPEAMPDDPRIDSPFMKQRITRAIGDQLTLKGMKFIKTSPDVIVKYHLGIKKELESDESGVFLGYGTSTGRTAFGLGYSFPAAEVATIENLAITIDIVNAENKQLLWRGSVTRRLYEGSTPASNTQLVNEMVMEILGQFPPG